MHPIDKSCAAAVVLVTMMIISGCIEQPSKSDKLLVVATIQPLGEFVRAVGGDRVDVTVLLPPGAEPHTFEPTPAQMKRVESADLYVKNGAGLELWLDRFSSEGLKVVDASEGVELIYLNGTPDPHIWLSPRSAEIQVENICRALIEVDPEGREFYENNRDAYIKEVRGLDEYLRSRLASAEGRIFVVDHPAWSYLARDYGLVQVAIEEGEREPGPRRIGYIVKTVKDNDIKAILVEPEFNPKMAEVIASEAGCQIVEIDPLAGDYINNMRAAGDLIAESIGV
ncbi:metal ABC transporter substrate-binding protein [Methanothrix sp.]|uniref:metal ABC transporter substrate-binding protein n=1 Tax=Methanothrix sp. TaxID=90426 RepID=UPI003C751FD1